MFGQSNADGSGVWGIGTTGAGVTGHSTSGAGIVGRSTQGPGIQGRGPTGGFFEGGADAGVHAIGLAGGPAILAKGTHGPAAVFEGDLQVRGDIEVSGDIRLLVPHGDVAELFGINATDADANADATAPGTVMVAVEEGRVAPSGLEYDRRVVGVVAGAGAYRPGLLLDSGRADAARPIAIAGRAYCKADATFGQIEVGDLLTTCSTPGYAMRASDVSQSFGAVFGKALGSLSEGQGMVPILIALQ